MLPLLALGAFFGSSIGMAVGKKIAEIDSCPTTGFDHQGGESLYPIVREQVIQEESIILAVEDVPLDNRFGTRVLVSEHEFSRTASATLKISKSQDMETSSEYDFRMIESVIKGKFAKQSGIELGSQVNRRVRLKFEADPGKFVHYRMIWKQESRRGLISIELEGKCHQIPYLVTYGLYHSVESLPQPK